MTFGFVAPLHAQSVGTTGTVAISSQLVDRGVAITPSTPILQGAVSWSTPSGWSLGLSGSTRIRSPGRIVETLAQAAHSWTVSSDWQMQAALIYYRYPSSGPWHVYDRTELAVYWIYRDILTVGLSGSQLFHGADHGPRGAADIGFRWPLAPHLTLSAGAGIAQTLVRPRYPYYAESAHYAYGQLGLIWDNGPWRVELAHIASDQEKRHGQPGVSPWTATIARSF
ncbi:uncharacterized protein (TIGR02001 family) [Luteibacter rhizovicinus]|uniref:Uncharacterized protein (TIGR02001 family) n=1 Tax=Luteibacter rhizovicinus TaxID=242606 RepID=A0A4R3Z1T7_9GAMM|nr:hypothetical protein [Luteibacter rhizovicinus]TCV97824.1 uncharacterized protein (TIGR02001 family) [Luteibacter rhizovicinus]